ncbi:MAG: BatD family protein, partial [Planctomycetes bacterium]|nr:BatD family protein [Planctomycetota bacterium]
MTGSHTHHDDQLARWLAWPIGVWLFVLTGGHPAAAQEPEILVELSSRQIYEGESVRYRVTLNNVKDKQPPRLEGFDDFKVQYLGPHSLDSRQVTVINGEVTETVRYGWSYDYALTPHRSGSLVVPGPVAEVDGRTLRGKPLKLNVIAPEDQDLAIVETTAEPDSVYPLQPFTIRLTVAVKGLPEPFTDQNPVAVLRQLPLLTVPWVDDAALPDGIVPEVSWQRWLSRLQGRRSGGFSINRLGSDSVFSFFNDGPSAYLPESQQTTRKDASGQEVPYWEFPIERSFIARKPGPFEFGPVTLKGRFITEADSQGNAKVDEIYVIAKAVTVDVKEPPLETRPASYINAIGRFTVDSMLVPERAKVGDPVKLTVTLRGQGTLDTATAPDLSGLADVKDLFRVYDATEESDEGSRRFSYNLRPLEPGEIEFPAIPVSYFDVEKEQYVTLYTEPIPILVETAEHLRDDQIAVAAAARDGSRNLQAREGGIQANIDDPSVLLDQTVRPAHWWTLLSTLAVGYVAVVLVSRQVARVVGDDALRRRRAAPRRARQRLRAASAEIDASRAREGAEQVGAALVGLVADVAGIGETGMTSREVDRQLVDLGVEDDLRRRLAALLEACDGARYGASADALHGLGDQAETLLGELIEALKR